MGTYLPGTGTLGWGAWCGAGTPHSQDIPPQFLSTTHGCGTSPLHICDPPIILDGCGFFNSIIVRFPFNSVSDGSKWWLFYILVVILIWFCAMVIHVCLQCHLDWKALNLFLILITLTLNMTLITIILYSDPCVMLPPDSLHQVIHLCRNITEVMLCSSFCILLPSMWFGSLLAMLMYSLDKGGSAGLFSP